MLYKSLAKCLTLSVQEMGALLLQFNFWSCPAFCLEPS